MTISTEKIDRPTLLGISAVISLGITISAIIFKVVPWDEINLLLLGGITGIGYTSLELTTGAKAYEGSVVGNSSNFNPQKWNKTLLMLLKNVGIALLISLCLILMMSLLMPKNILDLTAANKGFAAMLAEE